MAGLDGITFDERRVPSFSGTRDSLQAERVLHFEDWEDVYRFMEQVWPAVFASQNGQLALDWETYPGAPWLILDSFRIEGFDPEKIGPSVGTPAPCASGATVTLTYKTQDFSATDDENEDSDRPELAQNFLTHSVTGTSDIIVAPNHTLKYISDDEQVRRDITAGYPVTMLRHELQWSNLRAVPFARWNQRLGFTNAIGFLDHGPGIVLFSDYSAQRQLFTNGERRYTATLNFLARVVGAEDTDIVNSITATIDGVDYTSDGVTWNHQLRGSGDDTKKGKWEVVVRDTSTNDLLVKLTDFAELFIIDEDNDA